jgi:hypothetical protein
VLTGSGQKVDAGISLATNVMIVSGILPVEIVSTGLEIGSAVGSYVVPKVETAVAHLTGDATGGQGCRRSRRSLRWSWVGVALAVGVGFWLVAPWNDGWSSDWRSGGRDWRCDWD